MPPADPAALPREFCAAINAGDVDAALELWVEDPVMIQADGSALRGRAAVEAAMRSAVQQGVSFEIEILGVYLAGDLALAEGSLTLRGGEGEQAFEQLSRGVAVYARSAHGWRIAIDAPWGLPGD